MLFRLSRSSVGISALVVGPLSLKHQVSGDNVPTVSDLSINWFTFYSEYCVYIVVVNRDARRQYRR